MKDLFIVGAGGFGRELLLWAKQINRVEPRWNIIGFLDDNKDALDGYNCDRQVVGGIGDWEPQENQMFACGIAEPATKQQVVGHLKSRSAVFERIIHPSACVGEFNDIGEGVVMYPGASLSVNVRTGSYVTLLSTRVGHDVTIGDFTTISSQCSISGKVSIGERVFIGAGAVIIPSRTIEDDCYIGAGSVVVTNIKAGWRVMGNPAKRIRF